MPHVLAAAAFQSPLFWAVFIGWILSVVLHEFAHGLVGYLGGDYTVRERGGLTLNPLQYIDPVNSILLPAVFLVIGGVPLPGGVTYIHRELLRNKWWDSAVSLAGPVMNLLLFAAGAIALHPSVGWIGASEPFSAWTPAHRVVATLTVLQIFAVIVNLIPCPPLDGFGVIGPFLKPQTRDKLTTPPTSTGLMLVVFVLLFSSPVQRQILTLIQKAFEVVGYDDTRIIMVFRAFYTTLFGR
jgi:Zn-dependent protease